MGFSTHSRTCLGSHESVMPLRPRSCSPCTRMLALMGFSTHSRTNLGEDSSPCDGAHGFRVVFMVSVVLDNYYDAFG